MAQNTELQELQLPTLEQEQQRQQPAQRYLMEDEDGFMVSVPEDRQEAWTEAQNTGSVSPKAKQRLKEMLLREIYGERGRADGSWA